MQKRSELFFNLLLLPIDFIAVGAAFVLAYAIRVKIDGRPVANPLVFTLFLKIFLLIIPIWIIIFAVLGLYNQTVFRSRLSELAKIFSGVSAGVMVMILIDFASAKPIFPAKSIPIYGYGLSIILVTLGRQIVRAIQRSLFNYGIGIRRTLIIGSGPLAQQLAQDLADTRYTGYRLLGAVDSARNADKRMEGLRVYKSFDEAMKGVKEIDDILQADSAFEADEILKMVNYASNHHIVYQFVPNQFGLYAINATMNTLGGIPMIQIRKTPLDGWGRIVKRAFDVFGAGVGLLVFSPLMVLIALITTITDPGPIFYRHKRLSRTGKVMHILKFRTMQVKYSKMTPAEAFADMGKPELMEEFVKEQKLQNDPRVTSFGVFLRKSSLDELPQLWNVLKGELSLVGPRPIVEDELERYGEEQSKFLALKPGLTGLWQTSGRNDIGYDERVKLDIYYVENWSLWLDIKILFKTALIVLKGKGAY